MKFTYEVWVSEMDAFHKAFADADTPELALCMCMRGIAYVARQTCLQDPVYSVQVHEMLDGALLVAAERMTTEWVADQVALITEHCGFEVHLPT